jgi:hypothetical protein
VGTIPVRNLVKVNRGGEGTRFKHGYKEQNSSGNDHARGTCKGFEVLIPLLEPKNRTPEGFRLTETKHLKIGRTRIQRESSINVINAGVLFKSQYQKADQRIQPRFKTPSSASAASSNQDYCARTQSTQSTV